MDQSYLHLCWLLQVKDNLTQKELCGLMHLPKQTVNNLIRAFVEKGYIELEPAPSDHRAKVIRLTPEGRHYVEHVNDTIGSIEKRAFTALGEEQRRNDIKVQEAFYRAVCEEIGIEPYDK